MTGFKRHLFVLLIFSLSACAPEAPKKTEPLPEWIIPEEKMVDVLTDVHIVEGARIGIKVIGDSLPVRLHYEKIWQKHDINQELYDSSFRFYSRNAERMDKMYEQVLTRLTKISTQVEAAEKTKQKKGS